MREHGGVLLGGRLAALRTQCDVRSPVVGVYSGWFSAASCR